MVSFGSADILASFLQHVGHAGGERLSRGHLRRVLIPTILLQQPVAVVPCSYLAHGQCICTFLTLMLLTPGYVEL